MLLGSGAFTLTRSSTSKKLPIPRSLEEREGGRKRKGGGEEREGRRWKEREVKIVNSRIIFEKQN